MDITRALPTVDSVLRLEPEELASYLLEHLASNGNQLHLGNLLDDRSTLMTHYNKDERVDEAIREAWAWLEREGLLVPKAHGHFISRRGKRIRGRQDFEAFRTSSVLPHASLHPLIADRAVSPFVRGEYETAVFQAFKEVEVAVRAAGGFGLTDIGTELMGKAFNYSVGPLTDMSLPEAERRGMLALFLGAVGLFKNPSSHRHVALSSPSEAAEMVSFASLLLRIVDARASGARPTA